MTRQQQREEVDSLPHVNGDPENGVCTRTFVILRPLVSLDL